MLSGDDLVLDPERSESVIHYAPEKFPGGVCAGDGTEVFSVGGGVLAFGQEYNKGPSPVPWDGSLFEGTRDEIKQ